MANNVYVPMWCSANNRTLVGRFSVESSHSSQLTLTAHALHPPSKAGAAANLTGEFEIADSYPGCAGCGNGDFAQCGVCSSLSCWSGSGLFRCGNCGNQGPVGGYITDIAYDRG